MSFLFNLVIQQKQLVFHSFTISIGDGTAVHGLAPSPHLVTVAWLFVSLCRPRDKLQCVQAVLHLHPKIVKIGSSPS